MSASRGEVERLESGNWHINENGEFVFNGDKMKGTYKLVLQKTNN